MWAVSPKLNNAKNDSPDLLDPIGEPRGSSNGGVLRANEGDSDSEPTNSE